jgi:arabinogalactan oligomer/maltooligosaccharide transport system permease protein
MRPIQQRFGRLLFATLALGLVACGGGGDGSGEDGITEIVLWEQRDPQEREVMQAILDEYTAANPEVTFSVVHYDTENLRTLYQTAATSGGGPDLVYGPSDQVGPFSMLEIIMPLDGFLPGTVWERFLPSAIDTLRGRVWAVPDQVGNHLNLLYNTDMMETPPTTFAEWVAMAKKHTVRTDNVEDRRYGLAFEFNEPFWLIPFLTAYGGWVMNDDLEPTLDTEASVRALTFVRDLRDEHRVVPRECSYQLMDTLFKEGKVAMIINGPWSFGDYRKAGVSFKLARLPRLEAGGRWAAPMVGTKGYSVNANLEPAKEPVVLELLDYLTSAEVSARFGVELGILPSVEAAYEMPELRENELLLASLEQWKVGRRMPVVHEMRAIWDAMRPNMQAVMNGSMAPEAAAAAMQEAAVRNIATMNQ